MGSPVCARRLPDGGGPCGCRVRRRSAAEKEAFLASPHPCPRGKAAGGRYDDAVSERNFVHRFPPRPHQYLFLGNPRYVPTGTSLIDAVRAAIHAGTFIAGMAGAMA